MKSGHHGTLSAPSNVLLLPTTRTGFDGYNYKIKKQKKPQMAASALREHTKRRIGMLSKPLLNRQDKKLLY